MLLKPNAKNIIINYFIQEILFTVFISSFIFSCSKNNNVLVPKKNEFKDTNYFDCNCVTEDRGNTMCYTDTVFEIRNLKYIRIDARKKYFFKIKESLSNNDNIINLLSSLYDLIDSSSVDYGKNIKNVDDSIKKLVKVNFCEEKLNNGAYFISVLYPIGIINIENEEQLYNYWLKSVLLSCRKKFIITETDKEFYKLELFRDTLKTILRKYDTIIKCVCKYNYLNKIINDINSNNYFEQAHYKLTDGMKYLIDNVVIPNILDKNMNSMDIICKGYTDETLVNRILYNGDTLFYPHISDCIINRLLKYGEKYNASNYNKIVNNNYIKGENGNCILSYVRAFNTVKYIKEKMVKHLNINYYYSGGGVLNLSNLLIENRKFEIILINNNDN